MNEKKKAEDMLNKIMPEQIYYLLQKLKASGYEAFLVGGCVRDCLLSKVPHDWDISTNALPNETMEVFSEHTTVPTGLQHGTVTVVYNGLAAEITTYRIDGEYSDGRHPDFVKFTRNLKQDLARRDFTVNAMAYSPNHGIIDFFGGTEDLNNKIIRCVGNPKKRFSEDALRILRALRFASVLSFEIDKDTTKAIFSLKENLSLVSAERITNEFKKLICGNNCVPILRLFAPVIGVFLPEIIPEIEFEQHNFHHCYTLWEHTLHALQSSPPNLAVRFAVLLHDIGKPKCLSFDKNGTGHFYGHSEISASMANEICRRLKMENSLRERIVILVKHHDQPLTPEPKLIRKRLNQLGQETFFQLIAVQRADTCGLAPQFHDERMQKFTEIEQIATSILEKGECFALKDLKLSGNDLLDLGIPKGKQIGIALNKLLQKVINGECENNKTALLEAAKNLK